MTSLGSTPDPDDDGALHDDGTVASPSGTTDGSGEGGALGAASRPDPAEGEYDPVPSLDVLTGDADGPGSR